jgi:hypothetical protein
VTNAASGGTDAVRRNLGLIDRATNPPERGQVSYLTSKRVKSLFSDPRGGGDGDADGSILNLGPKPNRPFGA